MEYEQYMSNAALESPSIAAASSVVDSNHVGVAITPASSASSYDLSMALAHVLLAYCYVLRDNPDYDGYLEISFVSHGNAYCIFDTTALEARNAIATGKMVDLLKTMAAKGKAASHDNQTQYSRMPNKSSNGSYEAARKRLNLPVRSMTIHITPAAQAFLKQLEIQLQSTLKDMAEKMAYQERFILA